MSPVLVITLKDLRQRVRDRSAIVLGFVAPLGIAALMSFAFQGTERFHMTIGVVDRDHGALATAFTNFLHSSDLQKIVTVRAMTDDASATQKVKDRALDAAIVVPPGFSQAVTGAGATSLQVLTDTDRQLAGEVTQSLATSFVSQVNADRLSVATAIAAGAPSGRLSELSDAATKLRVPVAAVNLPIGARPLKAVSYFAPAMAIFFLLFTVGFTARSVFSEQRDGMFDRIAAAPVRAGSLLLGKVLSVFVYGVVSLGTVLIVTSVFFGAYWGNPLAAAAICVTMVIAVVALTAMVVVLARTERQAEGYAAVVVFGLALLGGNFVSISAAPPLLRRLALLTPNGWALRGFVDLTTGATGAGVVIRPVVAILVFSAVVGGFAATRARRWAAP